MFPLLRHDHARLLELWRRAIEIAALPYPQGRAPADALEAESKIGSFWTHPTTIGRLGIGSLSMFDRKLTYLYARQIDCQALLTVVHAELEAEIEHLRTGRYPESIQAIDPFTGTPLRYDAQTGKCHSVGANQIDDGGKYSWGGPDDDVAWVTPP